jgi:hypothetical protein
MPGATRTNSEVGGVRPGSLSDRGHHVGLGGGDLPAPTTPDGRRGHIGFMCTCPPHPAPPVCGTNLLVGSFVVEE